jgi:hypothetical protein
MYIFWCIINIAKQKNKTKITSTSLLYAGNICEFIIPILEKIQKFIASLFSCLFFKCCPRKRRYLAAHRIWPSLKAYIQCCQGAEISASELKRVPTKIYAAGKIGGRIFFKYAKKGPKRGRTFLKLIIHKKTHKISAEKYTSTPDIFDFLVPLPKEIVCKRQ